MQLAPIRLHFLIAYSVTGSFLPYAPVYLNQLGLSDARIGWILAGWAVPFLFMPSVATHWADRHVSNRALMLAGYLGASMALGFLALAKSFWALLLGSLLFGLAYTPMYGLLDGLTLASLHKAGQQGRPRPGYHSLRVWGSFGYVLPSLSLIVAFEYTDVTARAAIVAAAICALAGVLTSVWLPRVHVHREQAAAEPGVLPMLDAWRIMRRPPLVVFMGALFLQLVGMGCFHSFYPRRLQELGIDTQWIGPIVHLGMLSEVPFVLGVGALLRVLGLRTLLLLGGLCLLVRMLLVAFSESSQAAILTQLLHGPTVVSLYIVPPMYIDFRAQPKFRNSMQGLYSLLGYGMARIIGATVGGYVARPGLMWTFVMTAILAAAAVVWLAGSFGEDRVFLERTGGKQAPAAE